MSRETWVVDPKTKKLVLKSEYRPNLGPSVQIVRDIDPYRTVAADKQTGKRENIGGRRQHREFLKRNGYIELGNETPRNKLEYGPGKGDIARDLKRALGE